MLECGFRRYASPPAAVGLEAARGAPPHGVQSMHDGAAALTDHPVVNRAVGWLTKCGHDWGNDGLAGQLLIRHAAFYLFGVCTRRGTVGLSLDGARWWVISADFEKG